MSDHENGTTGGEEGVSGMNASEVKFLVTCLNNTTAGSISIDYVKVADELGFKNHRSAKNKVLAIKKKFNLPLGSSNKGTPEKAAAGSRKASETSGPNEPAVPKTPSKQRVTKPRATSSTKKKATSKSRKTETEDVKPKADDEDEGANEAPVDKETESKTAYEEVFGKPDTDEDEEAEDEDEYA